MKTRVFIGLFLSRLGGFIQSLALVVVKPDDLLELNRQFYSRPSSVQAWSDRGLVYDGISSEETDLLEKLPLKDGRLLLLGVGGGREAISLAQAGFQVTGVDFVAEMVAKAREYAEAKGLHFSGVVQDFSELQVEESSYDIVWFSTALYSSIPTRKKRVEMLKRVRQALKPEGVLVCQFYWDKNAGSSAKIERLRKIFARLTFGNYEYEKGDMFWGGMEFTHGFTSENHLRAEFDEGGFGVVHIPELDEPVNGAAILRVKGK
jgi:SAM-dependent methyltransferase